MSDPKVEADLLGYMLLMRHLGGNADDSSGPLVCDRSLTSLARVIAELRYTLSAEQTRVLLSVGAILCQAQAREEDAREQAETFLSGLNSGDTL